MWLMRMFGYVKCQENPFGFIDDDDDIENEAVPEWRLRKFN